MARRLFIGLDLPDELKRRIGQVIEAERGVTRQDRRVRWVRAAKLHFTLKFLGEVDEEVAVGRIPRITEALASVCAEERSSPIRIRSAGAFPNERRPRVLWLDSEDPAGLLGRLAEGLESGLEPLGFARERRPFVAHLTLARLAGPLPPGTLERLRAAEFGEFRAGELVLFESLLSSGEYVPLERVPIGRPFVG